MNEMTTDEALGAAGALLDEIRAADLLCDDEDEKREAVRALVRNEQRPEVKRWLSIILMEAELFGDLVEES